MGNCGFGSYKTEEQLVDKPPHHKRHSLSTGHDIIITPPRSNGSLDSSPHIPGNRIFESREIGTDSRYDHDLIDIATCQRHRCGLEMRPRSTQTSLTSYQRDDVFSSQTQSTKTRTHPETRYTNGRPHSEMHYTNGPSIRVTDSNSNFDNKTETPLLDLHHNLVHPKVARPQKPMYVNQPPDNTRIDTYEIRTPTYENGKIKQWEQPSPDEVNPNTEFTVDMQRAPNDSTWYENYCSELTEEERRKYLYSDALSDSSSYDQPPSMENSIHLSLYDNEVDSASENYLDTVFAESSILEKYDNTHPLLIPGIDKLPFDDYVPIRKLESIGVKKRDLTYPLLQNYDNTGHLLTTISKLPFDGYIPIRPNESDNKFQQGFMTYPLLENYDNTQYLIPSAGDLPFDQHVPVIRNKSHPKSFEKLGSMTYPLLENYDNTRELITTVRSVINSLPFDDYVPIYQMDDTNSVSLRKIPMKNPRKKHHSGKSVGSNGSKNCRHSEIMTAELMDLGSVSVAESTVDIPVLYSLEERGTLSNMEMENVYQRVTTNTVDTMISEMMQSYDLKQTTNLENGTRQTKMSQVPSLKNICGEVVYIQSHPLKHDDEHCQSCENLFRFLEETRVYFYPQWVYNPLYEAMKCIRCRHLHDSMMQYVEMRENERVSYQMKKLDEKTDKIPKLVRTMEVLDEVTTRSPLSEDLLKMHSFDDEEIESTTSHDKSIVVSDFNTASRDGLSDDAIVDGETFHKQVTFVDDSRENSTMKPREFVVKQNTEQMDRNEIIARYLRLQEEINKATRNLELYNHISDFSTYNSVPTQRSEIFFYVNLPSYNTTTKNGNISISTNNIPQHPPHTQNEHLYINNYPGFLKVDATEKPQNGIVAEIPRTDFMEYSENTIPCKTASFVSAIIVPVKKLTTVGKTPNGWIRLNCGELARKLELWHEYTFSVD